MGYELRSLSAHFQPISPAPLGLRDIQSYGLMEGHKHAYTVCFVFGNVLRYAVAFEMGLNYQIGTHNHAVFLWLCFFIICYICFCLFN